MKKEIESILKKAVEKSNAEVNNKISDNLKIKPLELVSGNETEKRTGYDKIKSNNFYVIKENILLGDNNKLIEKSMFKGIRHFSYDLSQNENYSLNKLLGIRKEGKTPEHVNGRTNVGVYCLWLMITGKISTWEDFYNYLLKYACTLHTTPEFNRSIEKFQNHEEAITPEIYIREYEKEFNCKFNEEQKTLFAGRFLSTHYEKITRSTVIDLIREMK